MNHLKALFKLLPEQVKKKIIMLIPLFHASVILKNPCICLFSLLFACGLFCSFKILISFATPLHLICISIASPLHHVFFYFFLSSYVKTIDNRNNACRLSLSYDQTAWFMKAPEPIETKVVWQLCKDRNTFFKKELRVKFLSQLFYVRFFFLNISISPSSLLLYQW